MPFLRKSLPVLVVLLPIFLCGNNLLLNSQSKSLNLSERTFTIDSFHYQIDFGRGIDVQVTSSISEPISEIKCIFSPLGPRTVKSYCYPKISQKDGLIVEFTIDTGVRTYYPPGTKFQVALEAKTVSGLTLKSKPQEILYLNEKYPWRTFQSSELPIVIHFYGIPEISLKTMVEKMSDQWLKMKTVFDLPDEINHKYRAVIYPDIKTFNQDGPLVSYTAKDRIFFGGFAFHEYDLFVLASASPEKAIHELAHLIVGSKTNSPFSSRVPAWLDEGLAQYFETESSALYTQMLLTRYSKTPLLVLRNHNSIPGRSHEIGLFYIQSASFVGHLVEQYGLNKISNTLNLINLGNTGSDAMENVYGLSLQRLEEQWQQSLGRQFEIKSSTSNDERTISRSGTKEIQTKIQPQIKQPPKDNLGFIPLILAAVIGFLVFFIVRFWKKLSNKN